MPRISSVRIESRKLPLRAPYVLSFTTLTSFEVVLARLTLDHGTEHIGEVVPLSGYSEESPKEVIALGRSWAREIEGCDHKAARALVAGRIAESPCAASLLLSALDAHEISEAGDWERDPPLVYATTTRDPEIEKTVTEAFERGYRTIKVKLGPNIQVDLEALSRLRIHLPSGIRLRFDANQAYTRDEAARVLSNLESLLPEATELMEQPLERRDWDGAESLAMSSSIPIMMDESIREQADLERAARIGCRFVKLKLCKQGGVAECLGFAKRARDLGLGVVLGNGVATDVSNWLELYLHANHSGLFRGASEATGFTKLCGLVCHTSLRVQNGHAVLSSHSGSCGELGVS